MTDDDTTHDGDEPHTTDSDAGFEFDEDAPREGPPVDDPSTDEPPVTEAENDPATTEPDRADEPVVDEAEPERPGDEHEGGRVRRYVLWVALAVLGLFSVVLLFQFYGSTMQAITDWVGPEYRSLVRSAVSLVLLCLTLVGVVRITRELAG
ncbi:hypothetical protein [Haloarchaeobius litoreus]|uniref:DUF8060 domain-containing protein n=1 Tax=Haloarchaeobius litoreus TaxID=755306 RepID=A0ABD6DLF7_9EURY|nr:hypothetical protein [Haloarchaeobius litoreus]